MTFGPQKVSRHGNLRLFQVAPDDAGVYECTVTSRGKTLKAAATLTVLGDYCCCNIKMVEVIIVVVTL